MVQREEKVREEFAKRLALACKNAGLDDHGRGMAVARALGVTSKAVSKWLNAESMPRPGKMRELASFLQADPIWLQMGGASNVASEALVGNVFGKSYSYPLLTSTNAGVYSGKREDIELKGKIQFITTSKMASSASYWIEVKGYSMNAPHGVRPSFPDGMLILIDPWERDNIKPGDFCVAELSNSPDLVFRQFINEAGIDYLVALNPSFPMTEFKERDVNLVGKVVASKWADNHF